MADLEALLRSVHDAPGGVFQGTAVRRALRNLPAGKSGGAFSSRVEHWLLFARSDEFCAALALMLGTMLVHGIANLPTLSQTVYVRLRETLVGNFQLGLTKPYKPATAVRVFEPNHPLMKAMSAMQLVPCTPALRARAGYLHHCGVGGMRGGGGCTAGFP